MSALLGLIIPIMTLAVLLLIGGAPTDFELAAGASGLALVACIWVAIVLVRRWLWTRRLPRVTEADHILPWMLLTMAAVAITVGWLQFYRLGYALSGAAQDVAWNRWFVENRIVGSTITVALAAAMIAKLRYPLSRAMGRWWPAVIGTLMVLVFFGWALLARLL